MHATFARSILWKRCSKAPPRRTDKNRIEPDRTEWNTTKRKQITQDGIEADTTKQNRTQ